MNLLQDAYYENFPRIPVYGKYTTEYGSFSVKISFRNVENANNKMLILRHNVGGHPVWVGTLIWNNLNGVDTYDVTLPEDADAEIELTQLIGGLLTVNQIDNMQRLERIETQPLGSNVVPFRRK